MKENKICKSFVELAENILPNKQVEKFKIEQERQYRRDTYFKHKRLYDAFQRKQKAYEARKKAKEAESSD